MAPRPHGSFRFAAAVQKTGTMSMHRTGGLGGRNSGLRTKVATAPEAAWMAVASRTDSALAARRSNRRWHLFFKRVRPVIAVQDCGTGALRAVGGSRLSRLRDPLAGPIVLLAGRPRRIRIDSTEDRDGCVRDEPTILNRWPSIPLTRLTALFGHDHLPLLRALHLHQFGAIRALRYRQISDRITPTKKRTQNRLTPQANIANAAHRRSATTAPRTLETFERRLVRFLCVPPRGRVSRLAAAPRSESRPTSFNWPGILPRSRHAASASSSRA
jgi:hypothetical protein